MIELADWTFIFFSTLSCISKIKYNFVYLELA